MTNPIIKVTVILLALALVAAVGTYYLGPKINTYRYDVWKQGSYRMERPTGVVEITTSITVKDCHVTPSIAHVRLTDVVSFVNTDSRDHQLFFKAGRLSIPANERTNVSMKFLGAPGAYGYDCDSTKHVGIISVFHVIATSTVATTSRTK